MVSNTQKHGRPKTYLHALVVQLQTIPDPPLEHLADLRPIYVPLAPTLHPSLLVHYSTFDDPVTDGFTNNILRVFLRVEMKLDTNVA